MRFFDLKKSYDFFVISGILCDFCDLSVISCDFSVIFCAFEQSIQKISGLPSHFTYKSLDIASKDGWPFNADKF